MIDVTINIAWDVIDQPDYRPATFEPLAGSITFMNGLVQADGLVVRQITYAKRCTRPELRGALNALATYELEFVDVNWNPPGWYWDIVTWLDEHSFLRARDRMLRLVDRISEALNAGGLQAEADA